MRASNLLNRRHNIIQRPLTLQRSRSITPSAIALARSRSLRIGYWDAPVRYGGPKLPVCRAHGIAVFDRVQNRPPAGAAWRAASLTHPPAAAVLIKAKLPWGSHLDHVALRHLIMQPAKLFARCQICPLGQIVGMRSVRWQRLIPQRAAIEVGDIAFNCFWGACRRSLLFFVNHALFIKLAANNWPHQCRYGAGFRGHADHHLVSTARSSDILETSSSAALRHPGRRSKGQ